VKHTVPPPDTAAAAAVHSAVHKEGEVRLHELKALPALLPTTDVLFVALPYSESTVRLIKREQRSNTSHSTEQRTGHNFGGLR
jgi:phosphoglycerate dehydrogenase-like enzyme